jgi:hypothetical protein
MFNHDNSPALPDTPKFSREMEQALVSAARGMTPGRPSRAARLRGPAIAGLAAAAVAIGAGIGIDHALSNGPGSKSPGSSHSPGGARARPVGTHLASFSVNRAADGTVTVTLYSDHTPDATALRRALAAAGVPALVTVGRVCFQPGPVSDLGQALSRPPHVPFGTAVVTITPSAIPSGSELSFGYFFLPGGNGGGIHVTIVPDHAHLTCKKDPPFGPLPR